MTTTVELLHRFERQQRREHALGGAFVRAAWAVPAAATGAWIAVTAGWLPSRGAALFGIGAVASLVAAASFVRLARGQPWLGLDSRLDAGDALATMLGQSHPLRGPAAELVARDVQILARPLLTPAARRRFRLRTLLRLAALAILLLLAFLVLPGHRSVPGQGAGDAGGGGAGATGAGRGGSSAPVPAANESEPEGRRGLDAPGKPRQRGDAKQAGRAPRIDPERLRTAVVFPDFRGGGGDSEREAPVIERAPVTGGAKGGAGRAERRDERPFPEADAAGEWRRQRERALARGTLNSWEGQWLHLYGSCLEGGAKK